jgi:hypothetical protein
MLEDARAVRFIDLGTLFTRYVRLDVISTWATGTSTKYANRLLIDQVWAGRDYIRGGERAER